MNCSIMSREYWAVEFISNQQSHRLGDAGGTNLLGRERERERDEKVNIQHSTVHLLFIMLMKNFNGATFPL